MARFWRSRARSLAAAFLFLAAPFHAPPFAQDQGQNAGTDLYERPVLAVDPGMHTTTIWAQSVDSGGRFGVTGGADRTVRIWSIADGKLLRTIFVPAGPDLIGVIYAVAINPDGSIVAAGGWTETRQGGHPIYLFDRETGGLIRRIVDDLPNVVNFLTFSPDGRYLAATLGGGGGVRVFDRSHDWGEAFRDDGYGGDSSGAAFASDGRLATTSSDQMIRLYGYAPNDDRPNIHRINPPVKAPSGNNPFRVAFSPDGKRLAVGYVDAAVVDVLDGSSFEPVLQRKPTDLEAAHNGIAKVAWSGDGQTLFATGTVVDGQGRDLLLSWDRGGLGDERRLTYCASNSATGVNVLPDGRILVASMTPCLGLMDSHGEPVWTVASPILDFRDQRNVLKVSQDGSVVDFGYPRSADAVLRFDVKSLKPLIAAPKDDATFAPNRDGLTIDRWWNGTDPTLEGRALPLVSHDIARSLAIASDAKRFFLGSSYAITAFDDAGTQKWRRMARNEVWVVNASKDRRIVVAAEGDSTIHWLRADDGRELLALMVLRNRKDWVLWTPEGFYEATPGAQDVLKWVTNHGPDRAASTLPVSAIPKLHRPDALPLVLQELETARALGVADVAAARSAVRIATGSAKPPGGVLHVLAVGLDTFGDKAGGLHLDYAIEDARDVANALLASQKGAPGKAALYGDVRIQYLSDETEQKPTREGILKAMDTIAREMCASGSDQDVAVVLISTHGAMIGDEFYLVPFGVDPAAIDATSVSATEFARKVKAIAEHGKALLLLDACHSGAVGLGKPDARVLRNAVNMDTVTVLTSSKKDESSLEIPTWRHGAFTQAFLDALSGAADKGGRGAMTMAELASAMDLEVEALTKGKQHMGPHVNFLNDTVFIDNR